MFLAAIVLTFIIPDSAACRNKNNYKIKLSINMNYGRKANTKSKAQIVTLIFILKTVEVQYWHMHKTTKFNHLDY